MAGAPRQIRRELLQDTRIIAIHGKSDRVVEFSQSQNFARAWGTRAGLTFVELEGQDHHLRCTKARNTILTESLRFLDANHPGRR